MDNLTFQLRVETFLNFPLYGKKKMISFLSYIFRISDGEKHMSAAHSSLFTVVQWTEMVFGINEIIRWKLMDLKIPKMKLRVFSHFFLFYFLIFYNEGKHFFILDKDLYVG